MIQKNNFSPFHTQADDRSGGGESFLRKLNCAGVDCGERGGCRRWEIRIPDRQEVVEGVKVPRFEWASFDVERLLMGSCESRIVFKEPR